MPELRKAVSLVTVAAAFIGLSAAASAAVVQPCASGATGGPHAITVKPILGPSAAKSGGQTYCQSAYGWTDTWFPTQQPKTFNIGLDVFSGDDAPSVSYTTQKGAVVGSGNRYNFIGPWLDGGTRGASFIGSNWQVTSDIAVKDDEATSSLLLPVAGGAAGDGLALTITTTVAKTGVTEKFVFTNKTGASIEDLLFDDYFNFHPDGSLSGGAKCGITKFNKATGAALITGTNSSPFCTALVSSGSLTGSINGKSAKPEKWDLGRPLRFLPISRRACTTWKLAHSWATARLTCCGIWVESLCLVRPPFRSPSLSVRYRNRRHWLCSALVRSGLGLFAGAVAAVRVRSPPDRGRLVMAC